MFSALPSSLGFSTRPPRGRECVRLLTSRVSNRHCVAANVLDTTAMTSRPSVADMFNVVDDDFFHRNTLQPYLPDKTNLPYQPRARTHHITLNNKTIFLYDTDFIVQMLYKYYVTIHTHRSWGFLRCGSDGMELASALTLGPCSYPSALKTYLFVAQRDD